jgi:hypothetical protein
VAKQVVKKAADDPETAQDMKRWSDAKLDRERAFAEACVVDSWPETIAWRDAIRNEVSRRGEHAAE